MIFGRKKISGSTIGGIKNTKKLLEFCAEKQIFPDVEVIQADKLDWAWKKLYDKNPDGVRYVLDVKGSISDDKFVPNQSIKFKDLNEHANCKQSNRIEGN